MSLFRTSRDCINTALHWAGELTDVGPNPPASEYRTKALEYLNHCYLDILSGANPFTLDTGEPFPWARSELPGVINLQAIQDVTATLTYQSDVGTFGVAPTISLQGRLLRLGGFPDALWITEHNANETNFKMDSTFTGVTDSYGCRAHKLRYELEQNVLRLVAPMRVYRQQGNIIFDAQEAGEIFMDEIAVMIRKYPLHALQAGVPERFAIRSESQSTHKMTVQFNVSPLQDTRVEYEWIPYPEELLDDDASVPILPAKHRKVLSYGVSYYIALDKNDDRRAEFEKKYMMGLQSIADEYHKQRVNANPKKARLIPRLDQTNRLRYRRRVSD